jgi:acyl-CoA synthetase (AMP-forming)/AMP-acid ligase II
MGVALENDFGPAAAIHVIERERITHLGMVVSFFTEMFRSRDHELVDLSSLEVVILGSEPLPPPLLERIKARLPQVQLYSFYGSAEAMYTTFGRLDDGSQDLRSSGRARAGCAVKVIDQRGQRVIGEVGTLCHAGAHVMRGYLKHEALTESVLRDGWYVGEDLGVMHPDGTITVIGRRSDAIAIGDTWVQPGEIEAAAMAIPGVAEAGAVGVPEGGERQQILLAVAPIEGVTLREDDLHRALESTLAAPLRPHRIVVADVLPHNEQAAAGTGKLLRSAIRDRWGEGLESPSTIPAADQASA